MFSSYEDIFIPLIYIIYHCAQTAQLVLVMQCNHSANCEYPVHEFINSHNDGSVDVAKWPWPRSKLIKVSVKDHHLK